MIPHIITGFDGRQYKIPHYVGDYKISPERLGLEVKIKSAGACGCDGDEHCWAERNSRCYWLVCFNIGTHYEKTDWLGRN